MLTMLDFLTSVYCLSNFTCTRVLLYFSMYHIAWGGDYLVDKFRYTTFFIMADVTCCD